MLYWNFYLIYLIPTEILHSARGTLSSVILYLYMNLDVILV